jgi:preprotein translocase subunit YajC
MRFRKSIKIAPGVKINVSKSGISTTVGKRGLSASMGKNGVYLNTGLPGTGLSTRTKIDGGAETQEPEYEHEPETVEQTENVKTVIKDIPTLKRGLLTCYVLSGILALLGIISIATIILPILFFIGAVIFFMGARQAKKQIKELETAAIA